MKRTQFKDALRNIRKQKVSYLSIVVIAALGVTMFLGIDFAASALWKVGTAFYGAQNYRDVELASTLLLTEGDLSELAKTEGVKDVEGVLVTNAKVSANGVRKDVQVQTLTQRINLPVVREGRLPACAGECAVEQHLAEDMGWRIGDTIVLGDAKGNAPAYLKTTTATICGIVLHPDHISLGLSETQYVLVTRDAFDSEQLKDCYMKAEITTDAVDGMNRYGDQYRAAVRTVTYRLETLGAARTVLRDEEVRSLANEEIEKNRNKLDDAERQLQDARKELDNGAQQLADGEAQYADGAAKLEEGRKRLDETKAQLEEAERKLREGRAQLDDAKKQIDDAEAQVKDAEAKLNYGKWELVKSWNQIEDVKEQIRSAIREWIEEKIGEDTSESINWAQRQSADVDSSDLIAKDFYITTAFKVSFETDLVDNIKDFVTWEDMPERVLRAAFTALGGEGEYDPETARQLMKDASDTLIDTLLEDYNKLADGCAQWDSGHRTYLRGRAQYLEGLKQFNAAKQKYDDAEAQYAEGLAQYEAGKALYEDGEAQYEKGVKDLEDARRRLDEGYAKLADAEAQYADGLAQYEDGRRQLDDAVKKVESLEPCKWISLDCYCNAGFVQLGASGDSLKSMQMTFSMMFILVGALVIYATISKMVDEQRTLVGTTKALGFFNREVFAKYLIFGVSATLLGALIGLIFALTWIQSFALDGYNTYFAIDLNHRTAELLPTVIVLVAGVLLAIGAIWFASRKLLKLPAIQLMQQAVPKGRKKNESGRSGLPLYSRLILRNIRTDWKRVLVTIVSVAGCCALVVIGFTLRSAVAGAAKLQFSKIIHYDGLVRFDSDTDENAQNEIERTLAAYGADACPVVHEALTVHIKNLDLMELYAGDLDKIRSRYMMNDVDTGKPIVPSDEGCYVSKRFSEIYNVRAGDTFAILNGAETVKARIAGVINTYIGRAVYMSDAYYASLFGKDSVPNAVMLRLNGADEETVIGALEQIEGYESYTRADAIKTLFDAATSVMNAVVLLFIFMAGLMAGVVLMNLTNIYIMQKTREMTVMRVNGFTVKEVIGYVLRETVVTTILGIVFGIGAGIGIGYKITRSLEQSFVQFDRSVSIVACLIGTVMTILFTIVVNLIALRKVRRLKLTDVA